MVYASHAATHNTCLQTGIWWWTVAHQGAGAVLSGFVLTSALLMWAANCKTARWDRPAAVCCSAAALPLAVFFFALLAYASASEDARAQILPVTVLAAFLIQVIPAAVSAGVFSPILGRLILAPYKMALLAMLLTLLVAFVVLQVLTPAFAEANPFNRVLIRVLVFPLLIEMPAGAIRVASRYWLGPKFPLARMLLFLLSPVMLSSMVGRFLATNMETLAETAAVSILLSIMEVVLRSTMLWRDNLYARCCGRSCGGLGGKKKHARAEMHVWVMFMLFETVTEDIAILLSLPVTLLLRIPPIPGGEPLAAGDVVTRVLFQYVVEAFTDVGFVLTFAFMVSCVGVKYAPITHTRMEEHLEELEQAAEAEHGEAARPRFNSRRSLPSPPASRLSSFDSDGGMQTGITMPARIRSDLSNASSGAPARLPAQRASSAPMQPKPPGSALALQHIQASPSHTTESAGGVAFTPSAGLAVQTAAPYKVYDEHILQTPPRSRHAPPRSPSPAPLSVDVRRNASVSSAVTPGGVPVRLLDSPQHASPASGARVRTGTGGLSTVGDSATLAGSDVATLEAEPSQADSKGSSRTPMRAALPGRLQAVSASDTAIDDSEWAYAPAVGLSPEQHSTMGSPKPAVRSDTWASESERAQATALLAAPRPAYCSCRPLCMGRMHPLALAAHAELEEELQEELLWEQEVIWEPVPVGLVAAESARQAAAAGRSGLGEDAPGFAGRRMLVLFTMRMERVALMFLRGWDTRFKNYNWMLLVGTVTGASYVLRTFAGGSLCPFGDPDDSSTWSFDYCVS